MAGNRAGSEQTQSPDGKVSVRVSADAMEAFVTITPPRMSGQPVTVNAAIAELTKEKVIYGIDRQALEALVEDAASPLPSEAVKRPLLVAKGTPPVAGNDALVTYNEMLQLPAGFPVVKADGKADFYQLGLVHNVEPGTVLATRVPATKGTPGTNVLGAPVTAADGKEQPLKAGKGARVTDDGLQVVAEIAGHAVLNFDGRITVAPIFEIRGDVDTSTGNIEFVGTVVVRGNVNNGFSVKADQNVEVHGGVDGGNIEALGDVLVTFGIQGAGRGKITAGGQVKCRFMENADVRAGRDVIVNDAILHSRVRSGGKVQVTGRRGSIIGGSVKAKDEVSARTLGTNVATATEIEVGVSPEIREELDSVKRQFLEAEEGLRKAQQAVSLLREMEAKNPADFSKEKRDLLMKSLRSQYFFQGQRDKLSKRRSELEEEVRLSYLGKVKAFDMAYPGVKIIIGDENYLVVDAIQHVTFYLSDQHQVTLGSA